MGYVGSRGIEFASMQITSIQLPIFFLPVCHKGLVERKTLLVMFATSPSPCLDLHRIDK